MPHHAPSFRVASDTRPCTLLAPSVAGGRTQEPRVRRPLVLARRSCSSGPCDLVRTLRSSGPGVWSIMYYPSCTSQVLHRDADETVLSWLAGLPAAPAALRGPVQFGARRCGLAGGQGVAGAAARARSV